jgi:hypothetical protein
MIEDYEGRPGRPDQRANRGTSWGTVGSGGANPPKSSFPENRGVGSNRGSQPALFAPGHRDPLGKRSSHFNESQIRTYQDSGHSKLERRLLRMTLSGPLAFANRRSRRRGLTRLLIRRLLAPSKVLYPGTRIFGSVAATASAIGKEARPKSGLLWGVFVQPLPRRGLFRRLAAPSAIGRFASLHPTAVQLNSDMSQSRH